MAFGLTLWFVLVSVKECFGSNNTTVFHGTSPSASLTAVRPISLAQLNLVNTSTILLRTTSLFLTTLPSNLPFSSSSFVQSSPSGTVLQRDNGTFGNKNTSVIPTETLGSFLVLSTAALSNGSSQSGNFMSPSLSTQFKISSELKPVNISSVWVRSLYMSNSSPSVNTVVSSSAQIKVPSKTKSVPSAQFIVSSQATSVSDSSARVNSPLASNVSTRTSFHAGQESSIVSFSSSTRVPQGPNKIFVAEMQLLNMNLSSELEDKTSLAFQKIASTVTSSVDFVMVTENYYKGCKVLEISTTSRKVKMELTMGPGSSSDPKMTLARLKTAVKSGNVGNLTVDSNFFTGWLKKDPSSPESMLSGQLAGIALILFILVVLLLIICLGNFADQPVFNERELFNEEVSMENLGRDRDNHGTEDEEWKFDPLFAWSPRKSFDSKL